MIHVDENTYIPSVDETLGTLRLHNQMMPQFVDFDKLMMELNYLQVCIKNVSGPLFDVIGKPVKVSADNNMKAYLVRHNQSEGFDFTKEGLSLSAASIAGAIDSGKLDENTIYLLKVYQKYSSYVKVRGTLVSLLQNPISNVPSCDGHRMLIVRPVWAPQNTGRVAMRNPAIQNFDHALQELVTVPKGFVKIHTDSGQVEPRIVYSVYIPDKQIQALIRLYDDAYFGLLHYCTMPREYISSGTTDFKKMEITDEMKDGRKKIKTYSNAVMYGSKSNPTGDPVKAAMIERIGNHPLRQRLIQDYQQQISMGQTTFKTAFGTAINTANSQKFSAAGARASSVEEERLRLAINNPIQGTAADLMRISVYEANRILMNKAKKSCIVHYVHDAGVFAVHEDEYDAVAKELGDIVAYDVNGWLPIHAEPEEGRMGGETGLIKDLY